LAHGRDRLRDARPGGLDVPQEALLSR
jgi:hypothetical protein